MQSIDYNMKPILGLLKFFPLWRKKAAPFIQIVHFAFGLGAFISPMIANPFLLDSTEEIQELGRDASKEFNSVYNMTFNKFLNLTHDHSTHIIPKQPKAEDLKIHWAYIIISIFNLSVLIFFIIVYYFKPVTTEYPTTPNESTPQKNDKEKSIKDSSFADSKKEKSLNIHESDKIIIPDDKFELIKPLSPSMKITILALSVFFFHLYCGLEISFGSLLAPFAVKSNLRMTKSEGAFLTSTYWGMFTFFRIFSLFAITYFSPRCILIFNMALVMLSNVFLLPFANDHRWALWIGSGLMGLGCSSVFATMFGFVEQLTPVTARFTSITMIACCLGEFILPLLYGFFIDTHPEVFLYIIFSYSFVSLLVLAILFVLQHLIIKKQRAKYLN